MSRLPYQLEKQKLLLPSVCKMRDTIIESDHLLKRHGQNCLSYFTYFMFKIFQHILFSVPFDVLPKKEKCARSIQLHLLFMSALVLYIYVRSVDTSPGWLQYRPYSCFLFCAFYFLATPYIVTLVLRHPWAARHIQCILTSNISVYYRP